MTIAIGPEYGWVLLVAVLMGLSCIVIGFMFGGAPRYKVYTEEYMRKNFGEEHKRVTGKEIKKGGAPDVGTGYYSKNLSYEQWYTLSNGQRAHMNFVQRIAVYEAFLLVAGIGYPLSATILGVILIVGRFVYASSYVKVGPPGRYNGVMIQEPATLALLILAIMTSINLMQGWGSATTEL